MSLIKEYIAEGIRRKASELGFAEVGFSPATELVEDKERLRAWLAKGYSAGMGYMSNYFDKRTDPSLLVEGSLSVISLLHSYKPTESPLSEHAPKISRYAYGKDYHDVIRRKLSELFSFIRDEYYPALEGRFFVDSAPLLERALAVKSGLGWIGKNSMLINRRLGSYVFLSEILVNIELPYNEGGMIDRCGGCTYCIDACPTAAILPGRVIDGNRCISYLTIENKDDIPLEFKGKLKGWTFGCDICQEVCPWNRKAPDSDEPEFRPSAALLAMNREKWEVLSREGFSELFKGSAVKRAKYTGWIRNYKFVVEP